MLFHGPMRRFRRRSAESARRVLFLAVEEARAVGHSYVGTAHLLLSLAGDRGPAGEALRAEGATVERIRESVRSIPEGDERPIHGRRMFRERMFREPITERVRRAFRWAYDEAGEDAVRPEHLLLGLLRLPDGVAVTALRTLGVDPQRVRARLAQSAPAERPEDVSGPRDNVLSVRVSDSDLEAIDTLIEAGIHATRSEAAAWLIRSGIGGNRALLEKVESTVGEIRRLREQARSLLGAEQRESPDPGQETA